MTSQKQSQFTKITTITDSDYVPVFGIGTNEKILKTDLFNQIKDETQVFIYPTIEQLQSADLVADPDFPIYVRVEETGYRLYKITTLAAGVSDISLENGTTASLQLEPSKVEIVATFAALASTPATVGQIVTTAQHTSGGIGGNQFIAKSGSVTNDGGTQINSATAGVYWKIMNASKLSFLDFGAKGDGTTDDTTLCNSALLASGNIFVPLGTFLVTQLNLQSNQILYGAGAGSVIKQKASTAQFNSVLSAVTKSNITIKDLHIDGNGNNVSVGEHNHGIQVTDSSDINILNVICHDANGDSFYITSTTNSILTRRIKVKECTVYNLGRQGICVADHGARNVVISNNHARIGTYVTTSTSNGNPIHLEIDVQPSVFVGDITITGNTCLDLGISVGGNYSELTIADNTIRGGAFTGTFGLIGLVSIFDATITGNTIIGDNTTTNDGIYLQDAGASGAASVKNVVISNNVISKTGGHGITLTGSGSGIPSLGKVSVSGNIIDTVGTGTTKSGIDIVTPYSETEVINNIIKTVTNIGIVMLGNQNFTISGNKIYEWSGTYGIYLATNSGVGAGPGVVTNNTIAHSVPAGKQGVRVENEATNTHISVYGNDCSATATPINFGAASVKCSSWGNIVGTDGLTGSFTLAAAVTTTVTNTNVIAASKIILVPTNAAAGTLMGSAKALYVSARTAQTSFALSTASGVAAAGTETFDYWISS